MRSRTASNCGQSPRCPAVITIDVGFWRCSRARCSLVVRPPRERPSPWSAGSAVMPPGGSFCSSPFPCPGGVLVGAYDGGVHVDVPGDQGLRVRPGLQLDEDPVPGADPLPAAEQVVCTTPRPVPLGHVPPGDAGADPEPYAVDQLPARPYRRPLLDGRRKSVQPMADRLPDGNMQALQQFVNQSPWDPLPVRQRIAKRLSGVVRPEVWVVDDVSFPKCGKASVGVARQYCGAARRTPPAPPLPEPSGVLACPSTPRRPSSPLPAPLLRHLPRSTRSAPPSCPTGGADSTAILLMFLADPAAHGLEPDLSDLTVVHAITGDEFVDSLDYVNRLVLPLLRARSVRLVQLCRGARATPTASSSWTTPARRAASTPPAPGACPTSCARPVPCRSSRTASAAAPSASRAGSSTTGPPPSRPRSGAAAGRAGQGLRLRHAAGRAAVAAHGGR